MKKSVITKTIKEKILRFDGGYGTLFIDKGLKPGENPAQWNIINREAVLSAHMDYIAAGADILTTNTFGANPLNGEEYAKQVEEGINIAHEAASAFPERRVYIALDIGPCGRMLKPYGDLDFEDAVSLFSKIIRAADKEKLDLILLETFGDALETKAAVLAAKENSDLPLFVSVTYDSGNRTLTGSTPESMSAMLEGLGADAIGCNCSVGPDEMIKTVERLVSVCSVPVFANPNAGYPRKEGERYVYDLTPDEFAKYSEKYIKLGAHAYGGCCGTTPDMIRAAASKTRELEALPVAKKEMTVISSRTGTVVIGEIPLIIGERINPTGKPKLKEALRQGNIDYLVNEAISQQEAGAHILDVNVGLPEIDERAFIKRAVEEIQSLTDLPLQIDTVDPAALENALRVYCGKPLINSVSGKDESMEAVFPLAKKYGGAVIALTLDQNGIPDSAEKRAAIAARIVKRAEEYGIDRKNIIVDPLALTVSSDQNSAKITLEAIDLIKKELGVYVSLGVSNVSFGLPNREWVNSSFYMMALTRGLDLAIINPLSVEMMKIYRSYIMLRGLDEGCRKYIEFTSDKTISTQPGTVLSEKKERSSKSADPEDLCDAIVNGMSSAASRLCSKLLENEKPTEVIEKYIIPALDKAGKSFEEKKTFLPQLLMSADAASAAFEQVKAAMPESAESKGKTIIATVQGDLHDIGKNIVGTMLRSYGFEVNDLGKDVAPERIVEEVRESGVRFVGLSALMTTTVPAMKETIIQLRENFDDVFVVVGGAVLNQEYADMIGADAYAADAMETVRLAEKFYSRF